MIFSLCFFEAMNNIKIDYSAGSEEPEIDNWRPYLDRTEPGIFARRTESNHRPSIGLNSFNLVIHKYVVKAKE